MRHILITIALTLLAQPCFADDSVTVSKAIAQTVLSGSEITTGGALTVAGNGLAYILNQVSGDTAEAFRHIGSVKKSKLREENELKNYLERRKELLAKDRLSAAEKTELKHLESWMSVFEANGGSVYGRMVKDARAAFLKRAVFRGTLRLTGPVVLADGLVRGAFLLSGKDPKITPLVSVDKAEKSANAK